VTKINNNIEHTAKHVPTASIINILIILQINSFILFHVSVLYPILIPLYIISKF